jgi:hypothetical protein
MTQYPFILSTTVSAKAGDIQPVRFAVSQDSVYPTYGEHGLKNLDTLEPNQYRNQQGVRFPGTYRFVLLRNDKKDDEMEGNRTDHAGYSEGYKYEGGNRVQSPTNPGAIIYRGQPMGELTGTVSLVNKWEHVGFSSPGLSQGGWKWLEEQLAPKLVSFVKDNKEAMRQHTLKALEERMAKEYEAALANLNKQREAFAEIMATLRG